MARTFVGCEAVFDGPVLEYFKATGAGWQTRMNEALLEWVSRKSAR